MHISGTIYSTVCQTACAPPGAGLVWGRDCLVPTFTWILYALLHGTRYYMATNSGCCSHQTHLRHCCDQSQERITHVLMRARLLSMAQRHGTLTSCRKLGTRAGP